MHDKLFKSFSYCLIGGALIYAGFKIIDQHTDAGIVLMAAGGFAIIDIINIWSRDKEEKD